MASFLRKLKLVYIIWSIEVIATTDWSVLCNYSTVFATCHFFPELRGQYFVDDMYITAFLFSMVLNFYQNTLSVLIFVLLKNNQQSI